MTPSTSPFIVGCPSCSAEFPVDPGKVPTDGVPAICSACQRIFPVMPPAGDELRVTDTDHGPKADDPLPPDPDWSPFEDLSSLATEIAQSAEEGEADEGHEPAASSLSKGVERFGRRDVHDRARHLARVLVSDIIAYHPARYQESFARGTLKDDFEAEVKKSWKEYVDQVGLEMAESTPYFNEALNEVLAKGEDVF